MMTEITSSTTEIEYATLSQSLRDVIHDTPNRIIEIIMYRNTIKRE